MILAQAETEDQGAVGAPELFLRHGVLVAQLFVEMLLGDTWFAETRTNTQQTVFIGITQRRVLRRTSLLVFTQQSCAL